jgi:hypothetical protein
LGDGVAGSAGTQGGEQQDPGLERVQQPRGDKAAVVQVALGARERVGRREDGPGAGPGRQDHRDLGGDILQYRRERRRDVSHAHPCHDQPVEPVADPPQQLALIPQADHDEPDIVLGVRLGQRDVEPVAGRSGKPGPALDQLTERPAVGRGKGTHAGGVGLADPRGRVDLVGDHDHDAPVAGPRRDRGADRGEQVRRPVVPGLGRVAHRAGDDERLRSAVPQVEQVRGFLDRVRALGDDDRIGARRVGVLRRDVEVTQVIEGQRGTGQPPDVDDLDVRGYLRQAGNGGHELGRGQGRRHPAAGGTGHGDRSAHAEHGHPGRTLIRGQRQPSGRARG